MVARRRKKPSKKDVTTLTYPYPAHMTDREKQLLKKKKERAKRLSKKYEKWLIEQGLQVINYERRYAVWAKE